MRGRLSFVVALACCAAPFVGGCHGRDPEAQDAPVGSPDTGDGEGEPAESQGCQVRVIQNGARAVPKGQDIAVAPLDDVVLGLIGQQAAAAVQWRIQGRPLGSVVTLSAPDDSTTGFLIGERRGVDIAGSYEVGADVTDRITGTIVDCTPLALEVIPQDDLYIQLTWDAPVADVDLHATRARSDGALCLEGVSESALATAVLAEACDGADCSVGARWGCPDWGVALAPDTRPALRSSDAAGFGPETIAVPRFPQGGDVLVAASMPATGSAAGARLAVYIHGAQVLVAAHALEPGALWEAALVRWPSPADVEAGEVPCISAIEDGAVGECVTFAP